MVFSFSILLFLYSIIHLIFCPINITWFWKFSKGTLKKCIKFLYQSLIFALPSDPLNLPLIMWAFFIQNSNIEYGNGRAFCGTIKMWRIETTQRSRWYTLNTPLSILLTRFLLRIWILKTYLKSIICLLLYVAKNNRENIKVNKGKQGKTVKVKRSVNRTRLSSRYTQQADCIVHANQKFFTQTHLSPNESCPKTRHQIIEPCSYTKKALLLFTFIFLTIR